MANGLVLSLGGNALIRPGEEGDIDQQVSRARETFRVLTPLILQHERCLLVHGNGPQVGNELLRSEVAETEGGLFHLPLDVLVADCQGVMGYVLQRELANLLRDAGHEREVVTVVTQVRVDPADPAFGAPSKPVGRFHDEAGAAEMTRRFGWTMAEDAGRGRRRVVPSPRPSSVVEGEAIEALWRAGSVVIAGGGGGIPVVEGGRGLAGSEAVVDKDRTTALLVRALKPELVLMVTGVAAVERGFGTPEAEPLGEATTADLRALAAAGEFAPGSMGPKIEALVDMVEAVDGCEALVTSPESLPEALAGRSGTRIRRA
jgi:carbamate kinase